ncbi:MAG: hypothetical protein KF910_12920 [Brevundimonas sp.]|uniref:DUF2231 domain-containing protein n=1 Tax=Brevundimonas sp. TaxID=1871086 RepID=UPI0025C3DACA|nr:DUF2231 domain-containing protein [Brevundimonas sp.]MBX3478508.1 hypothetical protein [Brevundimonas sp.]
MISIGERTRAVLRLTTSVFLSFPIALFVMMVATDIAYLRTAEIQWTNFSAWLNVGGMVFGGAVLVLALIALGLDWRGARRGHRMLYVGLLGLMFVLGLINAFKHSQDAWSSVGAFGLILSIASALLALAAGVLFWSGDDREPVR